MTILLTDDEKSAVSGLSFMLWAMAQGPSSIEESEERITKEIINFIEDLLRNRVDG